jgi:hypothetical protein
MAKHSRKTIDEAVDRLRIAYHESQSTYRAAQSVAATTTAAGATASAGD